MSELRLYDVVETRPRSSLACGRPSALLAYSCDLAEHHSGPCATLNPSGLVIAVWPNRAEFCSDCGEVHDLADECVDDEPYCETCDEHHHPDDCVDDEDYTPYHLDRHAEHCPTCEC